MRVQKRITNQIFFNTFQVEELQLKSGLITQNPTMPSGKLTPARSLSEQFDASSIINEQNLNLYATRRSDIVEEDDDD